VPWYSVAAAHPVHASVFQYGAPCAGTAGNPNLVVPSPPALGSPGFAIGVTQARPNATAVLFASLGYDDVVVDGPCHAFLDLASIFLPDALTTTAFTTNAGGSGAWTTPIPSDPSVMGLSAFAQVLVWDPAGAALPQLGGAALTRAVRLVLGTP